MRRLEIRWDLCHLGSSDSTNFLGREQNLLFVKSQILAKMILS